MTSRPCAFGVIGKWCVFVATNPPMIPEKARDGRRTHAQSQRERLKQDPKNTSSFDKMRLDSQPSSSLRPAAGQHPASVLGAHTLPKSVLTLLLQVGRLLKRERHGPPSIPIPWIIPSNEQRIIGKALGACQFHVYAQLAFNSLQVERTPHPTARSLEALLLRTTRMPQNPLTRADQIHHKHVE